MKPVDRLSSAPQILASLVVPVQKECALAMVELMRMMIKVPTAAIAAEQEADMPVDLEATALALDQAATQMAAVVPAVAVAAAVEAAATEVVVPVVVEVVAVASLRASTLVAEQNKGPENLKCYLLGFKTCRGVYNPQQVA